MLISKTEYNRMKSRVSELESRLEKQEDWIKQLLTNCQALETAVNNLTDGICKVPDSDDSVLLDNDGMYNYQQYKEKARNRRTGGGRNGND